MDTHIEESFQNQFNALELLRQDAVPAELEFYTSAETELREAYEQMSLVPSEPTIDSLKKRYKRISENISYLEFDRNSETLGEHWNQWADTEIKRLQERLKVIRHQLRDMSSDIGDISISSITQEQYNNFMIKDAKRVRLEELNMLLGLKQASFQRKGYTDATIESLEEIQELRDEIKNLIS